MVKVFLACALGAFAGALVAFEVNGYLWWLGMLVGGAVGYLSYDFKEIITAIPRAWRTATSWRPDVGWWKIFARSWLYATLALTAICTPFGFLSGFYIMTAPPGVAEWLILLNVGVYGIGSPLIFGAMIALPLNPEGYSKLKMLGTEWNIVSVLFWQLPRGVLWLIRHILDGVRAAVGSIRSCAVTAGRFLWTFFKLIHSDERLLCAVDAALGAGVGFLTGSALAGAIFGGIFGVLNFELVSRRWLKLVSVENR